MPIYKAGQEIDAWCTRCKMDLTHRIVAVANNKPAKAECRTCYTVHVYRAPRNTPTALADRDAAARSSGVPRATSTRAKAAPIEHVALVPPKDARVHAYRMTERFTKDQWISHKTFGIGLVVNEVGADKIEVRFDGGPRVLVHGVTP
jgi:hypothetical protein